MFSSFKKMIANRIDKYVASCSSDEMVNTYARHRDELGVVSSGAIDITTVSVSSAAVATAGMLLVPTAATVLFYTGLVASGAYGAYRAHQMMTQLQIIEMKKVFAMNTIINNKINKE